MSLPGISSLTPVSNFNELASLSNVTNLNNPITPTAISPVLSTATDSSTAGTPASGSLATDLAALLKSLGSSDVNGAKAALAKVEADVKAEGSSASSSSGSNSTTGSTSGSQSTNPLTKLVNQLNTALNYGDTSGALQDLTTFLLNTGQGSGSVVNASA